MLEAVIFDVDGTLADTERDGHRVAFNAAFRKYGVGWNWDEALYGELLETGGGKERIRAYIERYAGRVFQADLDTWITRLHAAKTRHFTALLQQPGIPLRPGVARLLQELRQAGVRLAIATTSAPQAVTALLETSLGAESIGWFEVIGAGDVVAAKKPAPDIYRWVLESLALPPASCLAVEDSANGLKAALGAGLRTLITVNGYTARDDFTGAVAVLSDLGEPERPVATVLKGEMNRRQYVDTALLATWLKAGQGRVDVARSDPDAFDQRRSELLEAAIRLCTSDKQRLIGLQCRIDLERRKARVPLKACIRLSSLMWDSFHELNGLLNIPPRLTVIRAADTPAPAARILPFRSKPSG